MRAVMHCDFSASVRKHVCQALSSPGCSPDGQLTVFNYYYLLPSRPGSHGLGTASRWRGHAMWDGFGGPEPFTCFGGSPHYWSPVCWVCAVFPAFAWFSIALFALILESIFCLLVFVFSAVFDDWCIYLTLDLLAASSCPIIFSLWSRIIEYRNS